MKIPAEYAFDQLIERTVAEREMPRVFVLGNTRMGKSSGINALLQRMKPRVDLVMIHDRKYPVPQYVHDSIRAHPDDLQEDDAGRVVEIFERPMIATPNALAECALALANGNQLVFVVVDEMRDALDGKAFDGGNGCAMSKLMTEGGGLGAGFVGTTQIPQAVPTTILFCCNWFMLFRMSGAVLRYMARDLGLSDEVVKVIPTLQPGQFVLQERGGEDWDGTIYVVPRKYIVKRPQAAAVSEPDEEDAPGGAEAT